MQDEAKLSAKNSIQGQTSVECVLELDLCGVKKTWKALWEQPLKPSVQNFTKTITGKWHLNDTGLNFRP